MPSTAPADDGAFSTLLISMPPLPSYPVQTTHEIRLRRNAPRAPHPDDARSLFLKNVPADATEAHLRAVFTSLVGAGRFESVSFPDDAAAQSGVVADPAASLKIAAMGAGKKRKRAEQQAEDEAAATLPPLWTRKVHRSGATAVVLLADEKSVQLVLKAVAKTHKSKAYPVWGDNVPELRAAPPLGAPWIEAHLRLARSDKAATQRSVHAFFAAYNRKEKEAADAAKRLRSEPDEDGFVTVTRGSSRTAPASKVSAEEARRKMAEKEARKKEEMKGFYRFQLREMRKEEQGKLLKRFEEDRRRVEAMKEKRGKFRPES